MLVNAILMKILSADPWSLARGALITIAVIGVLASLAPAIFFQLIEFTPKAKARRKRDLNAKLLADYEKICARLVEASDERDRMIRENIRLAGLVAEQASHGIDYAGRARTVLRARQAGE
jgi:hypothetical protein